MGLAVTGGILLTAGASGCSAPTATTDTREDQLNQSQKRFDARTPPDVTGDAEYQNYIRAQEDVYDDPSNILWCTAAFPNATSPIFTTPIAGKLTSSSVSYYPNEKLETVDVGEAYGEILVEAQSVDGMYHGSPGPYRYGFTPGGQYVDYTGMAVFCTTALTAFQQQTLELSVVATADEFTEQAEEALRDGDPEKAQDLVDKASE